MVTQPLHLQRDMTHDALDRSTAATPSTHIEACMTIHTYWCVRGRLIAAAPLSLSLSPHGTALVKSVMASPTFAGKASGKVEGLIEGGWAWRV